MTAHWHRPKCPLQEVRQAIRRRTTGGGVSCYLCEPDEYPTDDDEALDAWNEACSDCDARYWSNPVFIVIDEGDAA